MKKVFKQSLYVQVLAMLLIACSGDDELDGKDAVGFESQFKRGTITVELTGKTSDGKDINEKKVFAYSPTIIENTSECRLEESELNFYIKRFSEPFVGNAGEFENVFIHVQQYENTFNVRTLDVRANFLINNKVLGMVDGFSGSFDWGIPLPGYSYDPATGKLKFYLQTVIDANRTRLNTELNMKVSVDAIVYKPV